MTREEKPGETKWLQINYGNDTCFTKDREGMICIFSKMPQPRMLKMVNTLCLLSGQMIYSVKILAFPSHSLG